MFRIFIVSIFILFNGCTNQETIWRDVPFIEMEQETIMIQEHIDLCELNPGSIFCTTSVDIGDIRPTRQYALEVLYEMNSNFKYTANDIWIYNDTVYQYLEGDCEDIVGTMTQHMINGGISYKYLYLVYRKVNDTTAHMFLAVDTSDAGLLHLDYSNSGYPIEPQINFHMKMTDAGPDKWVKGNIK